MNNLETQTFGTRSQKNPTKPMSNKDLNNKPRVTPGPRELLDFKRKIINHINI